MKEDGNRIFLTWNTSIDKNFDKMRLTVRQLRALGNTFRGCSYDVRVPDFERCPVCGCMGTMDARGLAGLPDSQMARTSHVRMGVGKKRAG